MQGRLLAVGLLGWVDFVYPSGQRSRGSPGKTGETSSPAGGPGSTRGICVGDVVQRPQQGWKKIQTSHFSSQWLESKYLNNRILFLWWRVKFPQTTLGKHFFILLKWNAWKKHSVKENYSLQVSWAEHTEGVNLEGCCFRRTRSIKHSCFGAPCTFFFQSILMHSKEEGCSDGSGTVCVCTTNITSLGFALFLQLWIVVPGSLLGCKEREWEQHRLCPLPKGNRAKFVWALSGRLSWHGKVYFPRKKSFKWNKIVIIMSFSLDCILIV